MIVPMRQQQMSIVSYSFKADAPVGVWCMCRLVKNVYFACVQTAMHKAHMRQGEQRAMLGTWPSAPVCPIGYTYGAAELFCMSALTCMHGNLHVDCVC